MGPVYVFIRSWNRPLYLWACLDSVYRNTRTPCRVVLIDNHSTDPQVAQVIDGFNRRGMFHAVHMMERNHGANQALMFFAHRREMGRYLALLDGDVIVEPSEPDWLERLVQLAEARPKLAVLGSSVDQGDFVELDRARQLEPTLSGEDLARLIKARSPERRPVLEDGDVINPHTPPGRLLLVRTAALEKTGLPIGNMALCHAVRNAGFQVGVARDVRHRHLSLLNIFDYPDYSFDALSRYLQGE